MLRAALLWVVAGLMAFVPAAAFEVVGNAIMLNEHEQALCQRVGCTLITNVELLRQLDAARAIGCKAMT